MHEHAAVQGRHRRHMLRLSMRFFVGPALLATLLAAHCCTGLVSSGFAFAPRRHGHQAFVASFRPWTFRRDCRMAVRTTMPAASSSVHEPALEQFLRDRLPGVALVALLAMAANRLASLKLMGGVLSPLLYATMTGLVVGNVALAKGSFLGQQWRPVLKPGIAFAKARMLRAGIILYGFKVSLQQLLQLGPGSFISALVMVFSTLAMGLLLGEKLLKIDRPTTLLVTTGASICGVSAVIAAAPVVEKEGASGAQVSIALATVMVFGICSMFAYPLLWAKLPWASLSEKAMGIYTGATVYEVAGVVAAGNAMGSPVVASAALLTKLVRVLLLAPFLVLLSRLASDKKASTSGVQTPWFALAFFGVSVISSILPVPAWLVAKASSLSSWLTALAMVGLGLESDLESITNMGWRPMLLAALLFAYLVGGGLLAVKAILRCLPS
eukprot:TRINITY_DN107268_c0_g1_i1.p1 TRINITY_DN107268_c0_g1~~TRINITY_DN107268_c0_g1_i1.p1  ORF type:complete len:440 (+),score=81.32 TRINITY_DN107268_c0_g1_i1:31-1350(+)